MPIKAKFITEITLIDPDTKLEVQVTIYKEDGGGMFGVDSSFLANTEDPIYSPFIRGRVVKIEEEENPPVIEDNYTPRIKPGSPEFIALQQDAIREQNKVQERMNSLIVLIGILPLARFCIIIRHYRSFLLLSTYI